MPAAEAEAGRMGRESCARRLLSVLLVASCAVLLVLLLSSADWTSAAVPASLVRFAPAHLQRLSQTLNTPNASLPRPTAVHSPSDPAKGPPDPAPPEDRQPDPAPQGDTGDALRPRKAPDIAPGKIEEPAEKTEPKPTADGEEQTHSDAAGERFGVFSGSIKVSKLFMALFNPIEVRVDAQSDGDYTYLFHLPTTVRSWTRIGFRSVVVVVGSRAELEATGKGRLVVSELRATNATVIFLPSPSGLRSLIAQTSRLFVPCLAAFAEAHPEALMGTLPKAEDILVTSDSDLWPVGQQYYDKATEFRLDAHSSVRLAVTNAFCCGSLNLNGKSVRHVPIGHVTGRLHTWATLAQTDPAACRDSPEDFIIKRIDAQLGEEIRKKDSSKSTNLNSWYADQKLVSLWAAGVKEKTGEKSLLLMSHLGGRIDRAGWRVPNALTGYMDAHTYDKDAYKQSRWPKIAPLFKKLFPEPIYQRILAYREEFVKADPPDPTTGPDSKPKVNRIR